MQPRNSLHEASPEGGHFASFVEENDSPTGTTAGTRDVELLRFTTAGSVDDGKSTLIGRLLLDAGVVCQDQLDALDVISHQRGDARRNLALLTDGLRAERDQNITIDVAHRYFATTRRKFIVADSPGHEQYTRNMVTGTSTVDLTIVVIDAQRGLVRQSRRHAFISSLLRVPHVIFVVNKMDLVGYNEAVFRSIERDCKNYCTTLEFAGVTIIPISALEGDNVVFGSSNMSWYDGPTLLQHLEHVNIRPIQNPVDFRLPIQYVLRCNNSTRGYAGTVSSGRIRVGEPILTLPSSQPSRIATLTVAGVPASEAAQGDAVVVTISDQRDITRGDMLVRTGNLPTIGTQLDALVCWLSDEPCDMSIPYVLVHTTRSVQARLVRLHYTIDVESLHRFESSTLHVNDIGRVAIETASRIYYDPYSQNRATGSFILVHPHSNATVAAGMIRGETRRIQDLAGSGNGDLCWAGWPISRERREVQHGHRAAVVWFTGLSGSGKSTIAAEVERRLFERRIRTASLDGDFLRQSLSSDLGFSHADRTENIRRAAEVAGLLFEHGLVVLCAFVSPYRQDRAAARARIPSDRFFEVHVDCSVELCRTRDPKGLYARAAAGQLAGLTGFSAPYEPPLAPSLVIRSAEQTAAESADQVIALLIESDILPRDA